MAKSNLQVAGIGLFCLALLARQSGAYEFTVGGPMGWSVPSDPNVNVLNQWAEQNRFQIMDSVVFAYAPGDDSVLYVNQDDYKSCNTTSPIAKYVDGHTVFKFNHSGPFYFISGNRDKCLKNEKLVVIVLADRSKKSVAASPPPSETTGSSPPTPSPSVEPSPPPETTGPSPPAPSPSVEPSPPPETTGTSPPSPSPSAEQAPSPPPSETADINPTPAPAPAKAEAPSSKEPSPGNNAGTVMVSLAGSIGALFSLYLFLAP